jgi:hypothetical protein
MIVKKTTTMNGESNNDRSNFMSEYFHELPNELQNLIMSKTYRIPKPKFHKGSIVRYNEKRKTEMRKSLAEMRRGLGYHEQRNIGEQPFGRLIIWCNPIFNYHSNEWVYEYEYGPWGTSEGSAKESDLVGHSTQGGLSL